MEVDEMDDGEHHLVGMDENLEDEDYDDEHDLVGMDEDLEDEHYDGDEEDEIEDREFGEGLKTVALAQRGFRISKKLNRLALAQRGSRVKRLSALSQIKANLKKLAKDRKLGSQEGDGSVLSQFKAFKAKRSKHSNMDRR